MPGCAAQDPDQLRQWLYWVARTRKTLAREWGYGRDAEIAQRLFEIEEALMWVYCHLPNHGPVQDMQRAADCVCSMVNNRPDRYPLTFHASNLPARATNQWLPLTDTTKKNVPHSGRPCISSGTRERTLTLLGQVGTNWQLVGCRASWIAWLSLLSCPHSTRASCTTGCCLEALTALRAVCGCRGHAGAGLPS